MQDPAQKAQTTSPPTGSAGVGGGASASGAAKSYVLKFISGKYQGGEYQIAPDKQIIIGRSSDLDMVLVEDMVSRKHAKILLQGDQLWIEDLGSTNGTFVNGEKIARQRLKEGDRVLVGTSILKLVAGDQPGQAPSPAEPRPKPPSFEATNSGRGVGTRTMTGNIEEIPLPDLLQLLGTSKKNGVLYLTTQADTGKIFMRKGSVYFASINDMAEVSPTKSLYRMLSWDKGIFDFEPPDPTVFPNEVDLSVQEILMEGLRQLDEYNVAKDKLPPMATRFGVPHPLGGQLRALSKEELDIFQTALGESDLQGIFNRSPLGDLETATHLVKLLKAGYLQADG